jgi:hypothetical protein
MIRSTRPLRLWDAIRSHPAALRLDAALGSRAWTHVVDLHAWASEHAPDGDLSKLGPEAIAAAANWTGGSALVFVSELRRAGYLDDKSRLADVLPTNASTARSRRHRARNAFRVASVATLANCLFCPASVADYETRRIPICRDCTTTPREIEREQIEMAFLAILRARSRARKSTLLRALPWVERTLCDSVISGLFGKKLIHTTTDGFIAAAPPPVQSNRYRPTMASPRRGSARVSR